MPRLITKSWICYNGNFCPAGVVDIAPEDVEAMRPYGEYIDEPAAPSPAPAPTPTPKKKAKKPVEDDDII